MKRSPLVLLALTVSIGVLSQNVLAADSALENTKRNARDRSDTTMTSEDQGESKEDIRITADIRKGIMADEALSVNAQNIKVITKNGHVTLRGPVKTTEESAKLGSIAAKVAGVTKVDNQLEAEAH
jgi:hyperosmotically inducible protein